MHQQGNLKLTFKKPEDAQKALQTVKRVLKENACEYWHEYVAADNNQIIIGDGSESYHIDYFEFEGVLTKIGKSLAIDNPDRPFSGHASFWNSTTDWSGYDIVSYDQTTHILYVRENTEEGSWSVTCENCQEDIYIDLTEYDGETEFQCENCGEIVPLDEEIEDCLFSDSSYYLIKNGKAESISPSTIEESESPQ